MPTFLDLKKQAEAEGIQLGRAEKLPPGNYTLQLMSAKVGKTKKGDPSIALLWKTSDGRTAFQNLNLIPGNSYGNALTVQAFEDIGVTTDFLSRVDTAQGLEPFVPELLRVSQGAWYHTEVTIRTSDDGKYKNNDFYIKGRDDGAPAGPATQYIAPAAMQLQAAVAAPAVNYPVQPQPAPVPQAPPVPAPVPQPAGIPQPVAAPVADPATGFPPRPGV